MIVTKLLMDAALEKLQKICKLLRYDILNATTTAGSGHATSSLSAVELMTTLFFGGFLKYDLQDPKNLANDRVIFSKGHASPLFYSLYHAAGVLSLDELLTLRTFNSVLEGHPTPRFKYVDVATGSLGQGLSVGVGMAMGLKLQMTNDKFQIDHLNIENSLEIGNWKLDNSTRIPKIFVLLGDSEMAEGQVWEAMQIAAYYKLNNLIAILDVNRLGQRGETMYGWNIENYVRKAEAFGWETIIVDNGHDLEKIYKAFKKSTVDDRRSSKPIIIIAKTIKGKGISFLENNDGWHGKPLNKEQLMEALKELGKVDLEVNGEIQPPNFQFSSAKWRINFQSISNNQFSKKDQKKLHVTSYKLNDSVATREAYGDALVSLGNQNPYLVVLDAETSNSTYTEKFKAVFPDRFFEMFIAEQNMVSTALGISKMGYIPFISSFAAFLTRAFDQIRMAQYSNANIKIVGSHAGVSIGQDGPSQMGLEDIAMFRSMLSSVVFYPSDAVSTFKLTEIMAQKPGLFYLRTTREKTPVIYDKNEKFEIGGSKIHKLTINNQQLTIKAIIVAAGITLHEALKAQKQLAKDGIETTVLDCYSVKPIDHLTIQQLTINNPNIIVVEDHHPYGGLGESVLAALTNLKLDARSSKLDINFVHLCVHKLPRSGSLVELLRYEEIDAEAIVSSIKKLL